jgi:hypothetical protein
MISELLASLNARGKLSSYIDLLLATYSSARGHLTPSKLKGISEAEYTISELDKPCPRLNIQKVAEQGVAKVERNNET